jgi:hypothetical protein
MHVGTVDIHDELLVARMPVPLALKRQPSAIVAEVSFGILAPES